MKQRAFYLEVTAEPWINKRFLLPALFLFISLVSAMLCKQFLN